MPAEPRLPQQQPVPKDSRPAPVPKASHAPAQAPVPKASQQSPQAPVPKASQQSPAPVPKASQQSPAPSPAPEPVDPRRFTLILALIAAPLLIALAWSLLDDPRPPTSARRLAPTAPSADAPGPSPTTIRPQAPAIAVSVTVDPPRRLGRLDQLSLGVLDSDGHLIPTRLASALGRKISVVNVWATYCAPCMRELPRLLDLLAARPWGSDLRLVPVLLEAPDRQNEPQQAALRQLQAAPASKQQLVDLTPAGALQTLLHDAGLLPERATLPLTLVLDCEQQVRWLHRGELTDTTALAAVLDDLRAELPRCPALAPGPAPEPTLAEGCGDAYCDPDRAEDCATCPPDCACPENRECVAFPDRRARCNFRSQGLKD